MSKTQIEHQGHLLSFGWDRPFDTFFAQVECLDCEEVEEPALWIGSQPGEYRDLETFLQAFQTGLNKLGLVDFSLSEQQVTALRLAHEQSPPGSGLKERPQPLRDLMTILTD